MKKKKLLITIDTEGDNLWTWKNGDSITTENTLYLQRFQNLCNDFGFKTTWLTNYEMIQDSRYVKFARDVVEAKTGEVGMHLHAWNCPPEYELPVEQKGQPYLIEYPEEIMEKKIRYMTDIIKEKIGVRPIAHRAGRWAINQKYYELLEKYGYLVDCSVTPNINWNKSVGQTEGVVGSDYSKFPEAPYMVRNILEIPMTIRKVKRYFKPERLTIKKIACSAVKTIIGVELWFRPNGYNLEKMLYLATRIYESQSDDYIMFMIHSSELMPGGSPTFNTEKSIDKLYDDLTKLFEKLSVGFEGCTLHEYYLQKKNSKSLQKEKENEY